MDTIKLWARNGDAVRQAIELGELVHLETASEELTDEFLLFAIQSGLLAKWAKAFPDPRQAPEIDMEVIVASHLAARFAGLYSMRKSGYVLRSASVLGALGSALSTWVWRLPGVDLMRSCQKTLEKCRGQARGVFCAMLTAHPAITMLKGVPVKGYVPLFL